MKIRLFTIPNLLTLANLICGSLAICAILSSGNYAYAFLLVVVAGVFDFFDGFVARFLKQTSAIGGELDSLADVVSFGLAPAVIMMSLFADGTKMWSNDIWCKFGYYIPLIIVAFSALRLAKFNIDEEQTYEFIGLPTPACALFCAALGLLHTEGYLIASEHIALIAVVIATLLILPVRMFALKFKGFGWRGNEVRYIFLAVAAVMLAILQLSAIAPIILFYTLLSAALHFVCRRNKR